MNQVSTSGKVVVVGVFGERGVGKTALLSMFMKGDTDALGRKQSTSLVPMNALPNTMVITVDAGQDVVKIGNRCDAFIVMYSLVEKSSLEKAIRICKEIQNIRGSNNCPMVIVGNKADLEGTDESTSGSVVEEMLGCKHMSVSAKLNQNIKPVFQYILDHPSIPSRSSDMTYKLQDQNKLTRDLCPKIGFPENSSFRQKSGSLSCTNSDKHRWVRTQGRTHDDVHQAPVPRSRYAIRENADRESKKTSQESTEVLEILPPNIQVNSDTSMINDNSCNRRGRFSSVDSGYRSVSEVPDIQIQRKKSDGFGSIYCQTLVSDAASELKVKGNKPANLDSIKHLPLIADAPSDLKYQRNKTTKRLSVCSKTSELKVKDSKSKAMNQTPLRPSLCDLSSTYKGQGNKPKTPTTIYERRTGCFAKRPKELSAIFKNRSVCKEPPELQLQRSTCKDLSPVEVRRPMCNVPIAVGEKSVKPISVSMKSPMCDAPVDMKMKPRVSQDVTSTGFRRSVSDKTSVLKLSQNKADKKVFENVKAPQKKGKRVANGESRHRSVCETLPSLPRKKSGRLTSVDLSYLSACETLQKLKARQNKYDRVSLSDSQDFDASSDLRISGNTNTCFLNTPVNEAFKRDTIRSFDKQRRPRVNCNIPLNDSEIRSLRKSERGCQVM